MVSAATSVLIMASSVACTVARNNGSKAPDASRVMVAGPVEEALLPPSASRLAVENAMKISPEPLPCVDPMRPIPRPPQSKDPLSQASLRQPKATRRLAAAFTRKPRRERPHMGAQTRARISDHRRRDGAGQIRHAVDGEP